MYIVIEGQDGTGKSTQAKLLVEHLKKQGKETLLMEEPDGDLPQAHDLHDLILVRGKDYHLEGITNVLLFTAARVELWKKLAEPILKRDGYVVSARNWWSTLAYQAYGEPTKSVSIVSKFAIKTLKLLRQRLMIFSNALTMLIQKLLKILIFHSSTQLHLFQKYKKTY